MSLEKFKLSKFNLPIFLWSLFYAIIMILGYSIDIDYSFSFLGKNLLLCLFFMVLLTIFLYCFFSFIYTKTYKTIVNKRGSTLLTKIKETLFNSRIYKLYKSYDDFDRKNNYRIGFFVKFLAIFGTFLLFFLRFYPAIITPDTNDQIGTSLRILLG